MTDALIDTDRLFQTLLTRLDIPDATIANELDTDSFDQVPFITHRSSLQQTSNGPGLWGCTLTVVAFIVASDATFPTLQALYAGIHSWGDDPVEGIVTGVAAVEEVEDLEAFTRQSKGVPMLNAVVTPYVGSFGLTIRNH